MEVVGIVLPVAISAALHHARVKRWEARGPLGYKSRGTGARALTESAQLEDSRLVAKSSTELQATVQSIRAKPATSSWLAYQPTITGQRFLAKCNPFVVLQVGEQVRSTLPLTLNLEHAASGTSLTSPFMIGQQLDFSLPAAGNPLQLQAFLYARKAGNTHARLVALAAVSVDTLPATGQPLCLEVPLFERHGRQCGSIKLALRPAPNETGLMYPAFSPKMLTAFEGATAPALPPPIIVVSDDEEPSIAVPESGSERTTAASDHPSLLRSYGLHHP